VGLFSRFRTQRNPPEQQAQPAAPTDDEAVERYAYLLRTAPPETIEQVHAEAFRRLTKEQRELVFERLTANASSPKERPADAEPGTLARAATRAELLQPGALQRSFGGGFGGPSFANTFGASLLGTVAGYALGAALVDGFLPDDQGGDSDSRDDSSADAGGPGGGDFDGGGFGGGDFGGGGLDV
jgi:hypothetical protein